MNKIQALVRDVKECMKDIDIHFLVIQSEQNRDCPRLIPGRAA